MEQLSENSGQNTVERNVERKDHATSDRGQLIEQVSQKNKAIHQPKATPEEPSVDPLAD
jgi:hypothetical protein